MSFFSLPHNDNLNILNKTTNELILLKEKTDSDTIHNIDIELNHRTSLIENSKPLIQNELPIIIPILNDKLLNFSQEFNKIVNIITQHKQKYPTWKLLTINICLFNTCTYKFRDENNHIYILKPFH